MEIATHSLKFYQWNVFSLHILFKSNTEKRQTREEKWRKRKENRKDKFGQRCREEDKQIQWEKKSPTSHGPPHSDQCRHVCDTPRNQRETLKLPNSQKRQIFAKSMIWQSSCIFHTISMRGSIHLLQRADCHFPLEIHTCCTDLMSSVKLRHYHQLLVKRVSWGMGLRPFCWLRSVCWLCSMCHYIEQQTDKSSVITSYFLHLVL